MNEKERIHRIAEWYRNTVAKYRDKHYRLIAEDTGFSYDEVKKFGDETGANLTDLRTVFEVSEHVMQNT